MVIPHDIPTGRLSVTVLHRSDGDLVDLVHAKLHPVPIKGGRKVGERWYPTANRYDVLLPSMTSDELQRPEDLVESFSRHTVERQNAIGLHLKFTQTDMLPASMLWERARFFLLAELVHAERLPLVMVQHNPLERGFADAAPPHIHALVLARQRHIGTWGRTTALVFDRSWERLTQKWAEDG